ncbi:neuromedin Bb [Osmerus eperlanus]|uniref:neuromedin Bb n=1 Tax=Osmerus eperlanus TaxID=29151 RepID=UPI002E153913
MPGINLNSFCQFGFFTYLLIFSYISVTSSVSFDLTELRNKVAKIKVNPRGNLWATGHFMGKKSVMDNPMLPSPNGQGVDALEVSMSPERNGLGDLFQEVLRVALQAQVDTEESRSKNQETGLLMKILESYI